MDTDGLSATLGSIETLGREAMTELRQLLGAMFHAGDGPRLPQPGTDDLAALVADTTKAGIDASLVLEGEARPLPEPVDVSVYRLAQESLSNAMRHAPGSRAIVTLGYHPGCVTLSVVNSPGRGDAPGDRGLGLGVPGMRERARQFGGTLTADPTTDGGFAVRAELPTPTRESVR